MRFCMRFLYGITAAVLFCGAGDHPVLAVGPEEKNLHVTNIGSWGQDLIEGVVKSLPVDAYKNKIENYTIPLWSRKKMKKIPECPKCPEFPEFPECPKCPKCPECPEFPEFIPEFYLFTEKEEGASQNFYAQKIDEKENLCEHLKKLIANNKELSISDLFGSQYFIKNTVVFIRKELAEFMEKSDSKPNFIPFGPRLLLTGLCTDEEDNYVYKVFKVINHFSYNNKYTAQNSQ